MSEMFVLSHSDVSFIVFQSRKQGGRKPLIHLCFFLWMGWLKEHKLKKKLRYVFILIFRPWRLCVLAYHRTYVQKQKKIHSTLIKTNKGLQNPINQQTIYTNERHKKKLEHSIQGHYISINQANESNVSFHSSIPDLFNLFLSRKPKIQILFE